MPRPPTCPDRAGAQAQSSAGHGGHGGSQAAWFRVPTAPSIPTHSQSYGYEETRGGDLVMQKPPPGVGHSGIKQLDSVGPGEYDPKLPQANTAPAFARRSARKTIFDAAAERGIETPGPGAYQPRSAFASSSADGLGGGGFGSGGAFGSYGGPRGVKGSSGFRSTTKMAHQMLIDPETITPGPNVYQAGGALSAFSNMAKKAPPPHLQFFGSTQQRIPEPLFGSAAADRGPGPAAYNVASKLRVAAAPSAAAFSQTSLRFAGDVELARRSAMPGPGQYTAPSFVDEAKRRPSGRKGAFGTTARRFDERTSDRGKADGAGVGAVGGSMYGGGSSGAGAVRGGGRRPSSPPGSAHGGGDGAAAYTIGATVGRGGPSAAFSSTVPRFGQRPPPVPSSNGGTDTVGVAMSAVDVPGATGRRRRKPDVTPTSTTYKVCANCRPCMSQGEGTGRGLSSRSSCGRGVAPRLLSRWFSSLAGAAPPPRPAIAAPFDTRAHCVLRCRCMPAPLPHPAPVPARRCPPETYGTGRTTRDR